MTPTITVAEDLGKFVLMASSYGHAAIAGPRIFRAPPHPDIRFTHETRERADQDAETLRVYLATVTPKKKKKSTARSAHEE